MPDTLDPIAILLRFVGAFYAFAGLVAGRAALASGMLDAAVTAISGTGPTLRERGLTWWLTAAAWTVFVSGVLLMILAREALWAFVTCAMLQGFYLMIAAPYFFDVDDPPDATGRRRTTNAFFIYLGATLLVIWASGSYLVPIETLHPILSWAAAASCAAFALYLAWQSWAMASIPKLSPPLSLNGAYDAEGAADMDMLAKPFDPRMLRIALNRDQGTTPLKNQKTGADIDPNTLDISASLKSNLEDWFRHGDPEMKGLAYNLAEQLAQECPEAAIAEPGIPNSFFNYAITSPYENLVTSGPNWDLMTAVKIMCDYDCMPVWAVHSDAVGCMPPNVLGISGALEDDLLAWQDAFDASLNRDDPSTPIWSEADAAAHERKGLDLAMRVKKERPDLTVYVHSARGLLVVGTNTSPDRWPVTTSQS